MSLCIGCFSKLQALYRVLNRLLIGKFLCAESKNSVFQHFNMQTQIVENVR